MLRALDIHGVEPLAEGASFGQVGVYERVTGVAHGELDPDHPANRGIVNLQHAPRNASGRVAYSMDVYILRPRQFARGNGRMLYEVNNRGRKMLFGNLADGPPGVNHPLTLAELGNAFPLRQGYTLVWSGWDADAPRANHGLTLDAPVAMPGGQPMVTTIRDEFVSGTRLGPLTRFSLSHEAASLDPAGTRLTHRRRAGDARVPVAADGWAFVDRRTVELLPSGTVPQPGALYEFHYPAHNPKVLGIGFAATRDLVSRLRHDGAFATGGAISHVLAIGISQSARYLRQHIADGFNGDEEGRRVFDGVLAHIAGVGRVFCNTPFAQPWRTNTQHEDHDYPENSFPFSTAVLADPLTGARAALFRGDATDPLLMECNTSTEYWQKGASLLHTDPLGSHDVALPDNARVYMIAGTQHTGRAGATMDRGACFNPRNPHNPMPALRALLVALDRWVVDGVAPPPSAVPTLADGTLVEASQTGFPDIAGAAVMRITNTLAPSGDWIWPQPPARHYGVRVCRVDADGNEVAGIRLPDIAVPLATYTGWNTYAPPYPEGELADRDGSCLPFTPAEIARRYPNRAVYVARVEAVVQDLLQRRLLLPEDAAAYIARARQDPRLPQGDAP